jgi:hypothetical protein
MSSLGAGVIAVVAVSASVSGAAAARAPVVAHAAAAYQQCDQYFSPTRTASNPLGLTPAPPANPTTGDINPLVGSVPTLFVDGPAHGMAAGAIAQLLGINPNSYPDSYTWDHFWNDLITTFATKWEGDTTLRPEVLALAKIAAEPESQRLSLYSGGGGPGAIEQQTLKLFCYNLRADPNSIPLVQTFFIYPGGQYCPSLQEIIDNWPTFKRQIGEVAAGTHYHPAVFLLELDSIGSSACLSGGKVGAKPKPKPKPKPKKHRHHKHHMQPKLHAAADDPSDCATYTTRLGAWECELRYEIDALSVLPHTVVYTEGGYKDGTDATHAANVLKAIDVDVWHSATPNGFRGFYTNDTHNDWTHAEEIWGQEVSGMTHGLHFIVNTASNGRGPLRQNTMGGTVGLENLCNPPGRGLGPTDTTTIPNGSTYPNVDAFLWVHVPGRSSGPCNENDPAPGDFFPKYAIMLANNASSNLGP